jgi:predicted amidohydrolase YtcJ
MSEPGQLYFGGEIYTVDPALPRAEAVAVQAGKIIAVGAKAECQKALGKNFEPVDLHGRALLPGFIDTHLHPVVMIFYDINADLSKVTTIAELQNRLRRAEARLSPTAWLIGLNFDEQILTDPHWPTRHELDAACPDRPVLIVKHDAHMVIANTQAIAALKLTAATPDPPAGVIDREPDGFPLGPLRESAAQMALGAMPMPEIQPMIQGARSTFQKLVAHGITSVGIILQTGTEGPAGQAGAFDVLAMNLFADQLPVNLYTLLIADHVAPVEAARRTKLHQAELGKNRVAGIKIFSDGSLGACTAYMHEPFTDRPDQQGMLVNEPEEIYRRMVAAHSARLQIGIHAIGDKANRLCADLYARLFREYPRADHRHRIEHASVLDAGTIRDLARLNLVVATQPLFIHSEKHWLHKRLGAERAKWTYPFRAFLDAGIKLAGASDAPIESVDVLHAIQCCMTREGFEPQQGITAAEAVRMFTADAAYAQAEETVKGSITPGKRADLVVLSANPVSAPPDKIREIRVEKTVIGGRVLFENR